ncbi:hypothetical protein E4U33_007363 [Claviceps sp. LM78 group G4]|nr:hypothetical protein E4U33_007363 [Claviceps sp. LM78 group G4]
MHTPLDNAMRSKNMVLAFGAAVVAAAVWSIWGTEMFPPPPDPKGDPETWTREEMRRWLAAVGLFFPILPFHLADRQKMASTQSGG